jgi:hypothetical protein
MSKMLTVRSMKFLTYSVRPSIDVVQALRCAPDGDTEDLPATVYASTMAIFARRFQRNEHIDAEPVVGDCARDTGIVVIDARRVILGAWSTGQRAS